MARRLRVTGCFYLMMRHFYPLKRFLYSFLFMVAQLASWTYGNVEFLGKKLSDVPMDQQWTQGVPGEGYFTKQANAIMSLSFEAKITVGTLSSVWVNENAVMLMDDDATLSSENWSSMHIYGRFNLGKETSLVAGRYAHFATYINRTVSFGDRCRIKLGYWSSVYILDNFFVGSNTELSFGESSRIRINACGHPACVIGDGSRWHIAQSASIEIDGTLILLNAGNVTMEKFARFIMAPNSSIASASPRPYIFIGEQGSLILHRNTHCLLLEDLTVPSQTYWTTSPSTVDERVKCFNSQQKMFKLLNLLFI